MIFSSKSIELSETKTYLELKDLVCYYDAPNLNGVELPSDTAEEYATSLVDQPVYACYKANPDGEPSFSGHCAYIDEDGELAFGTIPIGVHTAVAIENHDVEVGKEIKNLPCLIATQRIWTRNKNAIAAVKRLYDLGELHNSWEIETEEYTFANGIKHITKYIFLGNTFLGWDNGVDPAYGKSAKVFSLSSTNVSENELLIAEAFAKDISEGSNDENKEDGNLKLKNENGAENSAVVEPVVTDTQDDAQCGKKKCAEDKDPKDDEAPAEPVEPEEPEKKPDDAGCGKKKCAEDDEDETARKKCKAEAGSENETEPVGEPEVSALTSSDLYKAVDKAGRNMLNPEWAYLAYLFPEDHKAWFKLDFTGELVFKQFDYVINENNTATVSNPVDIDLGNNVAQVSSLNEKIVSLTDALAEANKQVKALEPFKAEHEQAEKMRLQKEHEEAEAVLRDYAENSGYFSEDELDSDDMKKLISALDKPAIAQLIADKVVESKGNKSSKQVSETKRVDISSAATTDDSPIDYIAVMHNFLNN